MQGDNVLRVNLSTHKARMTTQPSGTAMHYDHAEILRECELLPEQYCDEETNHAFEK